MMIKVTAVLLLTLTLLALVSFAIAPVVHADVPSFTPPFPSAQSSVTSVPDFYADGTSGALSLQVSAKGGHLHEGPYDTPLVAWGSVTAQWSTGPMYIIFLANVTQNDFTIMFLYITNSTGTFILRIYKYTDDSLDMLTFDGSTRIYSRMVPTTPVPVPALKINAQAQTGSNVLSALGSDIYLTSSHGYIMNGSTQLTVYPLRDQYFSDSNSYNELWSLLTDGTGNYFFGILYMKNNDPYHVILEHQLRLNDYHPISGRTFDARWSRGFGGSVTLRLPVENATVNIDGFPFQTNSRGIASVKVPTGRTVIQVPGQFPSSDGGNLHFNSWSKFGNANPLYLILNSTIDLTANYTAEYMLLVRSDFGATQGGGWHAAGTNASFTVPQAVTLNNGTQRVFSHWTGDYGSSTNEGWVIMNSPKTVEANWATEYQVTLQLQGTPQNASVNILLNGQPLQLSGTRPQSLWQLQNSILAFQVQTTNLQDPALNYNFTQMLVDGTPMNGSVAVAKPVTIIFTFSSRPKTQSSVALSVTPSSGMEGYPLTIAGTVEPQGSSANVQLSYSTDQVNWQRIAEASPGSDGGFRYSWTVGSAGTYFIKALWPGDDQHTASFQVISVKVTQAPFTNLGSSNGFSSITQVLVSKVKSVPILAALFDFASSLLLLGFLLGTAVIPGGSTLLGYFIGSLIVGFVLVFPISTVMLVVKAVKTRRGPSILWLIPLATMWLASLGIIMTGTLGFSPLLSDAAGLLLVSSNLLMLPLTISVLVAKGVAT